MVGCLMLKNVKSTCLKHVQKVDRLLATVDMNKAYDHQQNVTIFYIYQSEKRDVWQLVLDLEMTNIVVGYGFGHDEAEAKQNATARLCVLLAEQSGGVEDI